jgi:multidrug efflux system membrane fusion protein
VATSRDVPAIVTALGTVQSIDMVNVTPRVNGRIEAIYFKQGDEVAKGQKLFLINPRPYQAALDQAKGQLAHDQAALTEAKMDLARYHRLLVERRGQCSRRRPQPFLLPNRCADHRPHRRATGRSRQLRASR